MISRFPVPYTTPAGGGFAGVTEYDNDVFIVESADSKPLTLDAMPDVVKAIHAQGWRGFTVIAYVDVFRCVVWGDGWDGMEYAPHSFAWDVVSRMAVRALIGEQVNAQ